MNFKILLWAMMMSLCLGVGHAFAYELNAGYDSQYITEGRNQLSSGGVYWVGGNTRINETIRIGMLYGQASDPAVNYEEINLTLGYSSSLEHLFYEITFTHLAFLASDETDNEIGATLEYSTTQPITPFLSLVYGAQAKGIFIESGLSTQWRLSPAMSFHSTLAACFTFYNNSGCKVILTRLLIC